MARKTGYGKISLFKTKRKYLIGGFFVFIILVIILGILNQKSRQAHTIDIVSQNEIVSKLADGDIIFRLGNRIWSSFLKDFSVEDRRYSHLGIVKVRDGIYTVIHSEGFAGDGQNFVKEVPLADFLEIALRIGIYRVDDIEGSKISDTALQYLDTPFDWDFDMTSHDRIYRTELLYLVLSQVAPEITLKTTFIKEIKKDILPLDMCFGSEYFTEIGTW